MKFLLSILGSKGLINLAYNELLRLLNKSIGQTTFLYKFLLKMLTALQAAAFVFTDDDQDNSSQLKFVIEAQAVDIAVMSLMAALEGKPQADRIRILKELERAINTELQTTGNIAISVKSNWTGQFTKEITDSNL
jgi:hypothetical protein